MYMYGHHQVVPVSMICLHKTHCLNEFISTHVFFYKCKHPHIINIYIYIQKQNIFGKPVDHPIKLAKTVFSIMIK